jgi:cytosine/adenosine deaminase-related metal-dependent hydrolase
MNHYMPKDTSPELNFNGVYMAGKPQNSRWDVCCKKGVIQSLTEHVTSESDSDLGTQFLCPSLCHPHIHLDKAFLLSHPKYADLEIEKGDFAEAMKLTSRSIFSFMSCCHFSFPS